MALTKEWNARIKRWVEELERNIYRPAGEVSFEGFVTLDQLTGEQAAASDKFRPYATGEKWGQRWEYGWFRTTVTVPDELDGKRLVFRPDVTTREALIWCNGQMIESFRGSWPWVCLSKCAQAGQKFEILMEAYAWHYQDRCGIGPVSDWTDYGPIGDGEQQEIKSSTFGLWDEEAFQLYMDVLTLRGIRNEHPASSLRVSQIDALLRKFTTIVDFQQDAAGRRRDYKAARELLADALKAKNGTVAPEFYAFGHAHLDIAWLWPLEETHRKGARTLANQLAVIDEYPGYKFMHSQPVIFDMVSRDYPELYSRVKKAVINGSIIADGAAWVEPDTNISGGEALIRQFLYGKKFLQDEFGLESRHLWLPDVFGYSAALPQIMRGCGVETFSTQKIFWNYHSEDTFPYHNFIWEGNDGSEVIVHLHHDYNSHTDPETLAKRWRTRVQSDDMTMRMLPFGWGDGGGGPDRKHLEFINRLEDCQGCPKVQFSTPQGFFDELIARGEHDANRWVGELYFATHRGVLTSQAKTKQGNRNSELALREAETWLAFAAAFKGAEVPTAQLEADWKMVLVNQFHDILPGSSIKRVYERAEADYAQVIDSAGCIADAACEKLLTKSDDSLSVFNSLGWARTELVEVPGSFAGDATQQIGDKLYMHIDLPACGWVSIDKGSQQQPVGQDSVKAEDKKLENQLVCVEFNDLGEISSMIDKRTGRELLPGGGNILKLFRDEPSQYDAWDIDSMYSLTPVEISANRAEFEVVSSGPLAGAIRITRRFSNSTLTQIVTLRRDSYRVDFETTVDWQETHRLLKVFFSPGIQCENAINEVQYGYVQRPTHTNRVPDQDKFEVSNNRFTAMADSGRGFAVLNDCKYGVSVRDCEIGLSLLRAPIGPDESADKGTQHFTYAALPWTGAMADSDVVRQGYELNIKPLVIEGFSGSGSILEVENPNIILDAVKPAEDGSGAVIFRFYESACSTASTLIKFMAGVQSVERTDMLENDAVELPLSDKCVSLDFGKFEVITLKVKFG